MQAVMVSEPLKSFKQRTEESTAVDHPTSFERPSPRIPATLSDDYARPDPNQMPRVVGLSF
jgi:hypothetical protein